MWAKRVFDVLFSATVLLLLAPLLLAVALWIRLDSPGPVLFRQVRVGRGGRAFRILKFRTMHETGESYDGPRVTGQARPAHHPLWPMAARHQGR